MVEAAVFVGAAVVGAALSAIEFPELKTIAAKAAPTVYSQLLQGLLLNKNRG